jgi:hypothetical protein
MKVQVKALSGFVHGRLHAEKHGQYELPKTEAADLEKAGLVKIVDESEGQAVNPMGGRQHHDVGDVVTDAHDDLLGDGGEKMDAAPKNKMARGAANKSKE